MRQFRFLPLAILVAPTTAFAAGGTTDFSLLLLPTVNFLLYGGAAIYLYKRFVARIVKARAVDIEQSLQRSARELAEVEAQLNAANDELAGISEIKQQLAKRFSEEGVQIAKVVAESAERSVARIASDGEKQIQNEIATAREQVRAAVVAKAAALVRSRLGSEFSADDDRKLRQSIVRGLLS